MYDPTLDMVLIVWNILPVVPDFSYDQFHALG